MGVPHRTPAWGWRRRRGDELCRGGGGQRWRAPQGRRRRTTAASCVRGRRRALRRDGGMSRHMGEGGRTAQAGRGDVGEGGRSRQAAVSGDSGDELHSVRGGAGDALPCGRPMRDVPVGHSGGSIAVHQIFVFSIALSWLGLPIGLYHISLESLSPQ